MPRLRAPDLKSQTKIKLVFNILPLRMTTRQHVYGRTVREKALSGNYRTAVLIGQTRPPPKYQLGTKIVRLGTKANAHPSNPNCISTLSKWELGTKIGQLGTVLMSRNVPTSAPCGYITGHIRSPTSTHPARAPVHLERKHPVRNLRLSTSHTSYTSSSCTSALDTRVTKG